MSDSRFRHSGRRGICPCPVKESMEAAVIRARVTAFFPRELCLRVS